MDETKTVSSGLLDLYATQCKDVAEMRASLLSFSKDDSIAAKKAMRNITVLRVHHQLSRIIRFTEMMDKIEDKMYSAIDHSIDEMDEYNVDTWKTLLNLQSRLQQTMIESHKLLEPYLNMEQLNVIDIPQVENPQNTFAAMVLNQEARENLRTQAQAVIAMLSSQEGSDE